jgi:tetratricopeptide (TPR) repeat protein
VYLLASLRHLRGAAPLALPGLALVLNLGLNLSAILLLPSFLVLLARALVTSGARGAALRDLALMGLLGVAINALMGTVRPGYNLAAAASQVVLQALFARGDRAQSLAYMFSPEHVRDFLNAQMLIGPAAAFLFVAGLAWLAVARARPTAIGAFFLAVGLVAVAGAWVTTDLGLGYARDWDLFAPSGIALTAAGLHVVLSGVWRAAELRRWLLALAAVCLFHAVPWVAVNASFERSFARFKTLPLGLGRTESAVGAYYLTQADTTQAMEWFQRAVDAYPANNVAAFRLGEIAMQRRMYADAARAFTIALRSRPDKELYRYALVDAILRGGAPLERAKPQADTLILQRPDEPLYWAALGMAHLGTGERKDATSAFARARDLAPDDTAYAKLLREADREEGDLPDVRGEWPALVDP